MILILFPTNLTQDFHNLSTQFEKIMGNVNDEDGKIRLV